MKRYLVLGPVICCISVIAAAQSHTWPPSNPGPAPIMQTLRLPGGKVLPSSLRWNLVWADQIVPQWVTPAQVGFAARNYIGTQKIFRDQLAEFEAVNSNFMAVSYHLAAGLNPAHNSDCPDPKDNSGSDFIGVVTPKRYVSEYTEYFRPWLVDRGIAENSPAFEAMFQHYDEVLPAKRVWHRDPYWLMNMDDAHWRAYLSAVSLEWMSGNGNQGMFFDVAVETNASLFNPNVWNPQPGNFDWWMAPHKPYGYAGTMDSRTKFSQYMNNTYRSYFQHVYRAFHAADTAFLVLPNTDQMITTVYDPVWLDGDAQGETVDGVMVESFGQATIGDMYLTLERIVRHVTGRGKILLAQAYPAQPEEAARLIGMFMLVKNENSYVNFLGNQGVEWYAAYEIDLGEQSPCPATLDPLREQGTGANSLWRRLYSRGMVLCNTADTEAGYLLAGSSWSIVRPVGGGDVRADGSLPSYSIEYTPAGHSVTIPSCDCVILRDTSSTGIAGTARPDDAVLRAFPQPAHGSVRIELGTGETSPHAVRLVDILGRSIPIRWSASAGEIDIRWTGIDAGVYVVLLESGGGMRSVRVVVAK